MQEMQWNPCMRVIMGLHADVREETWANAVFVHDPSVDTCLWGLGWLGIPGLSREVYPRPPTP